MTKGEVMIDYIIALVIGAGLVATWILYTQYQAKKREDQKNDN